MKITEHHVTPAQDCSDAHSLCAATLGFLNFNEAVPPASAPLPSAIFWKPPRTRGADAQAGWPGVLQSRVNSSCLRRLVSCPTPETVDGARTLSSKQKQSLVSLPNKQQKSQLHRDATTAISTLEFSNWCAGSKCISETLQLGRKLLKREGIAGSNCRRACIAMHRPDNLCSVRRFALADHEPVL